MENKRYKQAKQSYIDAKAAFEKAQDAVEAGRKAASDQASAALASIQAAWKNLEAKARTAANKMKNKKRAWVADSKAFKGNLAKAKQMVAVDPAGAKPKLDELKAMVDKWDNILKKMAAAPAKSPATKRAKKLPAKKGQK